MLLWLLGLFFLLRHRRPQLRKNRRPKQASWSLHVHFLMDKGLKNGGGELRWLERLLRPAVFGDGERPARFLPLRLSPEDAFS